MFGVSGSVWQRRSKGRRRGRRLSGGDCGGCSIFGEFGNVGCDKNLLPRKSYIIEKTATADLENHVISRKARQNTKVLRFRENAYNNFAKTCATLHSVGRNDQGFGEQKMRGGKGMAMMINEKRLMVERRR